MHEIWQEKRHFKPVDSTIYWNDNSGSNIEAIKMAEIEIPYEKCSSFYVELFYAYSKLEKVVFQKK